MRGYGLFWRSVAGGFEYYVGPKELDRSRMSMNVNIEQESRENGRVCGGGRRQKRGTTMKMVSRAKLNWKVARNAFAGARGGPAPSPATWRRGGGFGLGEASR